MASLPGIGWVGVRKGTWSKEEDNLLRECVEKYGQGNWHLVPSRAGLRRCRKSCRLRWLNYLSPDIKRGQFSEDEKDLIIRMHRLLGNRWSLIARRIPGRTANDVKNYWNCYLSKPQINVTRKPIPKMAPAAEPVRSTVLVKPQAHRIKMKSPHWFRKAASSSHSTEGQFPDEDLQRGKLMLTTHESQDNALLSGICLDLAGREEFAPDQAALFLESEVRWEDLLFDSELWNLLDI